MDARKMEESLPTRMPIEILQAAVRANKETLLGGDFLIYHRESWSASDGEPPQWDEEPAPRAWAASCRRTACGERFYAGWSKENRKRDVKRGVTFMEGPDGVLYPSVPDSDYEIIDADEFTPVTFHDDDEFPCPFCHRTVTLRHKSKFAPQMTRCLMCGYVANVGPYTALLFFMVRRRVFPDARAQVETAPVAAVAVTDERDLIFYRFAQGRWRRYQERNPDPFQIRYSANGGLFGHSETRIGGWMCAENIPNQRGMSAEKSGLVEYLTSGGRWPVLYLRLWRRFPNVENLVKSGWAATVNDAITTELDEFYPCGVRLSTPSDLPVTVDFSRARPADMLNMTRDEIKRYGKEAWPFALLQLWLSMVDSGAAAPGYVDDFRRWITRYQYQGVKDWTDYVSAGGDAPFPRLDRYLSAQARRANVSLPDAMRLFLDYRSALNGICVRMGRTPTDIELWPPRLPPAHDRVTAAANAERDKISSAEFAVIRERWAALEWSDGAICARLPTCNSDLIREGAALRHCVGGYGQDHLRGRLVIFIRHARRPERPWFTLNIDTTGTRPNEIQLHGYGNERAHGKRLRIPKRVRDFCDRWETEILAPAFQEVRMKRADASNRQPARARAI